MPDILDRSVGCLLGLAIGDAMGAPVEFCSPGSFPPVTGYRSGGWLNIKAGRWTDDTAMALSLAESLLACNGSDPEDQRERWIRWMHSPDCIDVGAGTANALHGGDSSNNMGNGCLMRLAPVPIFYRGDAAIAMTAAEDSCRVTHSHPEAIHCTRRFAKLLLWALNGEPKPKAPVDIALPEHPVAGGTAPQALAAALWAFASTDTFQDCILAAVNLGDDADTVGAIAGQLAGAHYGYEAIPAEWIQQLAEADRIMALATRLYQRSYDGTMVLGGNHG